MGFKVFRVQFLLQFEVFRFSMFNFKVRVFNLKVSCLPCPISRFGVSNFKFWGVQFVDSRSSMSIFTILNIQLVFKKNSMFNFREKGVQFEGLEIFPFLIVMIMLAFVNFSHVLVHS